MCACVRQSTLNSLSFNSMQRVWQTFPFSSERRVLHYESTLVVLYTNRMFANPWCYLCTYYRRLYLDAVQSFLSVGIVTRSSVNHKWASNPQTRHVHGRLQVVEEDALRVLCFDFVAESWQQAYGMCSFCLLYKYCFSNINVEDFIIRWIDPIKRQRGLQLHFKENTAVLWNYKFFRTNDKWKNI